MTTLALHDPETHRAYQRCDWGELVLHRHGWSGERLQKTARRIVNDYAAANIPYLSGDRRDEMTDFVVEKALQATFRFKPDHPTTTYTQNGGNHFSSWVCDVMAHRCTDWLRSKAEGNGDSRYGNDRKVIPTDMTDEADTDLDFHDILSERRLARWQTAARTTGFSFEEFVCIAVDAECQRVERTAA